MCCARDLPARSVHHAAGTENWEQTGLPPIIPRRHIQRLVGTHSERNLAFGHSVNPQVQA